MDNSISPTGPTAHLRLLQGLSLDISYEDLSLLPHRLSAFNSAPEDDYMYTIRIQLPSGTTKEYGISWPLPSEFNEMISEEFSSYWQFGNATPEGVVKTMETGGDELHLVVPLGRLSVADDESPSLIEWNCNILYCIDRQQFWVTSAYEAYDQDDLETGFLQQRDGEDEAGNVDKGWIEPYEHFPGTRIKMTIGILHGLFCDDVPRLEVYADDEFKIWEAWHHDGRLLATRRGRVLDIGETADTGEYKVVFPQRRTQ